MKSIEGRLLNNRLHKEMTRNFWPRRKNGSRLGLRKRREIRETAIATIRRRLAQTRIIHAPLSEHVIEMLAAGLPRGYDPTYTI